jgi:hypothetical protein
MKKSEPKGLEINIDESMSEASENIGTPLSKTKSISKNNSH